MAHNYVLQVTTGTEYDITKHQIVPVNDPTPVIIESEDISVSLNVRINSYRGLPLSSPQTSPYFSLPPHSKNKDQYALTFSFTPKSSINGNDLVFGNDFDHPIRDRLPPGFNTAFRIVKWVVDPGIDGDVYADKPYLYGVAGSSFTVLHVGRKKNGSPNTSGSSSNSEGEKGGSSGDSIDGNDEEEEDDSEEEGEEGPYGPNHDEEIGLVFEEGGHKDGLAVRRGKGIPDTEAGRRKFFLNEEKRKEWVWEEGREYGCDFFNPYIDFNDFALRLPGFTLPIMKYWDGQGARKQIKRSHTLRYVLKNRATDKVLFVVLFTLYLKDDIDENGKVKAGAEGGVPFELMGEEKRERHRRMRLGLSDAGENGNGNGNGNGGWWGVKDDGEKGSEVGSEAGKENEKVGKKEGGNGGGGYKGFDAEAGEDDVD